MTAGGVRTKHSKPVHPAPTAAPAPALSAEAYIILALRQGPAGWMIDTHSDVSLETTAQALDLARQAVLAQMAAGQATG